MIFNGLFGRRKPRELPLYAAIVAAARHPVPYADWGVADTLDGRFDMISLHLFLVLDRLRGGHAPERQELVDTFFADMDRSLRELGVGDISVGKKVRKMAESFYGRVGAYEKALEGKAEGMDAALARNVFPNGAPEGGVAKLGSYVSQCRSSLAGQGADALVAGTVAFPEPLP